MLDRPTTLSTERERAFQRRATDLELRVLDTVAVLLDSVDSEVLAETVSHVAFQANDVLPKRRYRPKLEPALLVSELYQAYADDGEATDRLLGLSVVVAEYYDVTDDLYDGDVTADHRRQVLLAHEVLVPVLVRLLGSLGHGAVEYWTGQTTPILESFAAELDEREPTAQRYQTILDRQTALFGSLTGVSAVVADVDSNRIEDAAALGQCYFEFEQLLLDREQLARDPDDTWNAWALMDRNDVVERLHSLRTTAHARSDHLPDTAAGTVRALFAVDVDEWLATVDSW